MVGGEAAGGALIPRSYLASPAVRSGLLAVAMPFFFMGAQGILITPYLMLVAGFSAMQSGMLSLLSGIPMFCLATFLPKLAPRLSSRLIIRIGLAAIVAACLLMALGVEQDAVGVALFAGTMLGGIGVGAVNSQANNAVACSVSREEAEQSGGIQGAARSIGLALGTALAGTCLLLTMAGGFTTLAVEGGVQHDLMAAATDRASTLMADDAFDELTAQWGASEDQAAKLVEAKSAAQSNAMRLTFGALGCVVLLSLLTTRNLVETAVPKSPGKTLGTERAESATRA